MEGVLKNLTDPGWLLPNFVLVLIAWLLPPAFRKSQAWFRQYARYNKIKNLKRVKELRWNSLGIIQLINRAAANYMIFVVLIVAYLYLIVFTPFRAVVESIPLIVLAAFPIYFFQFRWLIPDSLAKEAIKSRRKILGLRGAL